jgi:uncharacterized protein
VLHADAARAIAAFRADWKRQFWLIDATPSIVDFALDLAETHGLRGYDATHLAAALEIQHERDAQSLPALTFVSADHEQLQTAMAEGLITEDPNRYQ